MRAAGVYGYRRYVIVAIVELATVSVAIAAVSLNASGASAARGSRCDRGPRDRATNARRNLDQRIASWGVFCDPAGSHPRYVLRNVRTPSRDGRALECSYRGGTQYAGAHCYRQLRARKEVKRLRLDLEFRFSKGTCQSIDPANEQPRIQALEFSASRWTGSKRAEIAVQYELVGDGAPQWRVWDGAMWTDIDPVVMQCLEPNRWHRFALSGQIDSRFVRYDKLIVDGRMTRLTERFAQVRDRTAARLTVAVQSDGNAASEPFRFWIDRVRITTGR